MRHDAPNAPCCLMASDAEVEEDPDAYTRCDECPVAEQVGGLCGENLAAWRQYRQVMTRFSVDTQSVPVLLRWACEELDADGREDLVARFALLYDALCPPPERKASE